MTGTRTDVGEAEFLEELSDIAPMKVDTEPLGDDTLEVNALPARDPILLTIPIGLSDLRELTARHSGPMRLKNGLRRIRSNRRELLQPLPSRTAAGDVSKSRPHIHRALMREFALYLSLSASDPILARGESK
jgi:hypothetical protein